MKQCLVLIYILTISSFVYSEEVVKAENEQKYNFSFSIDNIENFANYLFEFEISLYSFSDSIFPKEKIEKIIINVIRHFIKIKSDSFYNDHRNMDNLKLEIIKNLKVQVDTKFYALFFNKFIISNTNDNLQFTRDLSENEDFINKAISKIQKSGYYKDEIFGNDLRVSDDLGFGIDGRAYLALAERGLFGGGLFASIYMGELLHIYFGATVSVGMANNSRNLIGGSDLLFWFDKFPESFGLSLGIEYSYSHFDMNYLEKVLLVSEIENIGPKLGILYKFDKEKQLQGYLQYNFKLNETVKSYKNDFSNLPYDPNRLRIPVNIGLSILIRP